MIIQEVKPVAIPHMEVVDKIWKLPVMEYAWNTSSGIYSRVKSSNDFLNWTLSTAEGAMQLAIDQVAPVAMKFEQPIHVVDEKLCQGFNKLEEKVPIVKEAPSQVYESAKNYVTSTIQPAVQTVQESFIFKEVKNLNVKSLKDLSWTKANEVLSSRYGHMALTGLDSTSNIADRYLDYYIPDESNTEDENLRVHPSSQCDDKVMHAVHTVGILSNKVSRRVYHMVSHQVSQINKQNINEYLSSLALVVQLTNILNSINKRVEQTVSPANQNQQQLSDTNPLQST